MSVISTEEKSINKSLRKFQVNQSSKSLEIVCFVSRIHFKILWSNSYISRNNMNFEKSFCTHTRE